eukprot:5177029-Pyramimonas_sp.AAC.1
MSIDFVHGALLGVSSAQLCDPSVSTLGWALLGPWQTVEVYAGLAIHTQLARTSRPLQRYGISVKLGRLR